MLSALLDSGRMEQVLSVSGFTFRSSANNGEPLKPNGFFNRAVIISGVLEVAVANEHWISLTEWKQKSKIKLID